MKNVIETKTAAPAEMPKLRRHFSRERKRLSRCARRALSGPFPGRRLVRPCVHLSTGLS
jgi:hypothetical protein